MVARAWPILLVMLGATAALAAEPTPACRAECGARVGDLPSFPPAVQACLVRCRAGAEYNRSLAATGAVAGRGRQVASLAPPMAPPSPAAPRGVPQAGLTPVSVRPGPVVPLPPLPGAPALAPRGAVPATAIPPAAAPPPPRSGPAPALAPPSLLGSAQAATRAPAPAAQGWGAIYSAVPPNPAFGMSRGQGDRMLAHVHAESACVARSRAHCRLVSEFAGCGAAAQAVRTMGLYQLEDPSTYQVTTTVAGSGPNREEAERNALATCSERDRSARCRIVASSCAG